MPIINYQRIPNKYADAREGRLGDPPITAMDAISWTTISFDKEYYHPNDLTNFSQWLRTNVEPGTFYVGVHGIRFKYEQDAIMFKLKFL